MFLFWSVLDRVRVVQVIFRLFFQIVLDIFSGDVEIFLLERDAGSIYFVVAGLVGFGLIVKIPLVTALIVRLISMYTNFYRSIRSIHFHHPLQESNSRPRSHQVVPTGTQRSKDPEGLIGHFRWSIIAILLPEIIVAAWPQLPRFFECFIKAATASKRQ